VGSSRCRSGQDAVEGGGELAGAVADEEPEGGVAVVEVHQEVAGLLGGPRSVGMRGQAEDVCIAVADFQGEEDVDPFEGDRAVEVEDEWTENRATWAWNCSPRAGSASSPLNPPRAAARRP
jgi:hypothetical protein